MTFSFNNSQRLGLDLDKHIAIDAGAGTGKTAVMAERYVQHLLAEHQRAKRLLPNGPRIPLQGQERCERQLEKEAIWLNGKDYFQAK